MEQMKSAKYWCNYWATERPNELSADAWFWYTLASLAGMVAALWGIAFLLSLLTG